MEPADDQKYLVKLKTYFRNKNKLGKIEKQIQDKERALREKKRKKNKTKDLSIANEESDHAKIQLHITKLQGKIEQKFDFDNDNYYITKKSGEVFTIKRKRKLLQSVLLDMLYNKKKNITNKILALKYDIMFEHIDVSQYQSLLITSQELEKELQTISEMIHRATTFFRKRLEDEREELLSIETNLNQSKERLKEEKSQQLRIEIIEEISNLLNKYRESKRIIDNLQNQDNEIELIKIDGLENILYNDTSTILKPSTSSLPTANTSDSTNLLSSIQNTIEDVTSLISQRVL